MADWYNTVVLGTKGQDVNLLLTGLCWIDVRDLAEAHALVLEKEGVAGERIIVSAGTYLSAPSPGYPVFTPFAYHRTIRMARME